MLLLIYRTTSSIVSVDGKFVIPWKTSSQFKKNKMETCSNCDSNFSKKNGGYNRYSLERTIKSSGMPATHHLSDLTGSTFTQDPTNRRLKFLCPDCWNKLNETVRYKASLEAFFKSTKEYSYIGQKKRRLDTSDDQPSTRVDTPDKQPSSSPKRPKFTSSHVKVSIFMYVHCISVYQWITRYLTLCFSTITWQNYIHVCLPSVCPSPLCVRTKVFLWNYRVL